MQNYHDAPFSPNLRKCNQPTLHPAPNVRLPSLASFDNVSDSIQQYMGDGRNQTFSNQSESTNSDHSRQKIERAISQLNMDEEEINDLKAAFQDPFSKQQYCKDAASALMTLFSVQSKKHNFYSIRDPPNRRPVVRSKPYPISSNGPSCSKTKQTCKITTNIQSFDQHWDVIAYSPDLESYCYTVSLVKMGSSYPNCVVFKGFAKIRISNSLDISTEKLISGEAVATLPTDDEVAIASISQFKSGQIRVRICRK
jgi:hypothetical protein